MNILISAVGGQGALLASRILGRLAQNLNLHVKVSEVHGMSQRGGSVVTFVKFGEEVYSPVIEKGTADIILSFEMLEGARYVDYLKPGGKIILNTQKIDPMPVITGAMPYPDNVVEELRKLPIEVFPINAIDAAEKAGNIKAVNVVLIGVLAHMTGIDKTIWKQSIMDTVPEKLIEVNLKAFEIGYGGI